ncbi:hypothetical protein DMN57_00560 [Escherichia coli]|nr:hypothetical protein [Escherichia coli]
MGVQRHLRLRQGKFTFSVRYACRRCDKHSSARSLSLVTINHSLNKCLAGDKVYPSIHRNPTFYVFIFYSNCLIFLTQMTPRLQPNEFSVTDDPIIYINYAKFMDELLICH